jgi:signal transduction histidine kinase
MKENRLSLQWKFLLSIALIVLPTLGLIFLWVGIQQEKQVTEQLVNQARILVRQIILTRQWVSDCGGVMVALNSHGASETSDLYFNDRIDTPRGPFQLFTPSMVTKKLSDYSLRQDLYRLHLTGMSPLNPENRPDAFEKECLRAFAVHGISELARFGSEGGKQYFQYMVPLMVEKNCIECHRQQGFSLGSVGGGLSVFLPADAIKASLARGHLKLAASGVGLIVLTVSTLFILLRRVVIKPLKELQVMTSRISEGDLKARVVIATRDEFDQLGQAFNSMAVKLSRNRDMLEERIRLATHELAEANRELQGLDKLKSDFIANMSHELRSPLTALRGGVDYLKRTVQESESKNYLDILDKNLSRLIHLVSDLFDFTKIEGNRVEWAFERESLSELTREVIEITSPLASEKYIGITLEESGEVFAEIDLERIEQVLVNLVENAIKFSEPGTEIRIHLSSDDRLATVAVRDQGMGISPENLDVIFEKFHTLPSSGRGSRAEGTGLGLAICKGIVQGHGGRIWAESTTGQGSIFYFTLPLNRAGLA